MHVHLVAASSLAGAFDLLDGLGKTRAEVAIASLIEHEMRRFRRLSQ
jgi:hypothetical protein